MKNALNDYASLHWGETESWDIDPGYPVLRDVGDSLRNEEAKAWLVLRHAAFYHLGSSLRSFSEAPSLHDLPTNHLRYPVSANRRGHRSSERLSAHWASLLGQIEQYGSAQNFLTPQLDGKQGWSELFNRAQTVHGNGRYFAYKIAELSKEVMGHNITAPDAGHAHSSGPRRGLEWIYPNLPKGNTDTAIQTLNTITEQLASTIGEPAIERVETSLCAFDSLNKGKNYLGLYIDEQQHELLQAQSDLTSEAFKARQRHIPRPYLGESMGWEGVQKHKMSIYLKEGRLVTPW